jgi:hypothetical protein
MDPKHTSPETVKKHCGGAFNTDILAGWEKGVGPQRKIGGRLYDHWPPEHLEGKRRDDWFWGYRCGKDYRRLYMRRAVHFTAYDQAGEAVTIVRNGWGVRRGQIVSRLEKMGCAGDVMVYYFEDCKIVRTVKCGI